MVCLASRSDFFIRMRYFKSLQREKETSPWCRQNFPNRSSNENFRHASPACRKKLVAPNTTNLFHLINLFFTVLKGDTGCVLYTNKPVPPDVSDHVLAHCICTQELLLSMDVMNCGVLVRANSFGDVNWTNSFFKFHPQFKIVRKSTSTVCKLSTTPQLMCKLCKLLPSTFYSKEIVEWIFLKGTNLKKQPFRICFLGNIDPFTCTSM